MAHESKRKKHTEDDVPETLPLPETIPKYEYTRDKNCLIYIFQRDTEPSKILTLTIHSQLEDLGFVDNIYILKTKKGLLDYLNHHSPPSRWNPSCVLVICAFDQNESFQGGEEEDLSMKDIWSPFINFSCLKSIPKIFIFQALDNAVTTDDVDEVDTLDAQDLPKAADVLIVYKKHKELVECLQFNVNLFKVIRIYGRKDHFIGLITRIDHGNHQPMIISTLTKKFYLPHSNYDLIMERVHSVGEKMRALNATVPEHD